MTFRSFVRPLFVALSLAFATTAAAPAFADNTGDDASEQAKGKGHGKHGKEKGNKGKGKGKDLKFPVDAEKFSKHVDTRIVRVKDKLSGALTKHGIAEAEKAKILKQFDDGAATVRAAVKVAAKDGQVTKEEAKNVRGLVKDLRKQLKGVLPKKADKPAPKDV